MRFRPSARGPIRPHSIGPGCKPSRKLLPPRFARAVGTRCLSWVIPSARIGGVGYWPTLIPRGSLLPQDGLIWLSLSWAGRADACVPGGRTAPAGRCNNLSESDALTWSMSPTRRWLRPSRVAIRLGLGVARQGKRWPLVLSAAFTQKPSALARWKEFLRWRFFRLHFISVCL